MKSVRIKFSSFPNLILVWIILTGLGLRIYLATGSYNVDIKSFSQAGEIFLKRGNIYLEQNFYNFSPLPFVFFGLIQLISFVSGLFSFAFLERVVISLVDVMTVFVLIKLAKQRNINPIKTAALFFLNPISIIISGHHGQIDNIAILFLLISIYFTGKKTHSNKLLHIGVWLSSTLGLIFKHSVLYSVIIVFMNYFKKIQIAFLVTFLSFGVFILVFLPYANSASDQIKNQVFGYLPTVGTYGISSIVYDYCGMCQTNNGRNLWMDMRTVFMVAALVFAFLLRYKDIARATLLGYLFFLTFTAGIGAQYFVFPIALGALFPTKWFYLYSIIAGLFALGNWDELNIAAFRIFTFNMVWLFATLWFISEMMIRFKKLRRIYDMVIAQGEKK